MPSGLPACAVFQPDPSIGKQPFNHAGRQPLSNTFKKCIILPERKPAFAVTAEPAFGLFHYIGLTARTGPGFPVITHFQSGPLRRIIIPDKIRNHPGDFLHEILRTVSTMLNFKKLLLPVSSHGSRTNLLRHYGNQGISSCRGYQIPCLLIAFPLDKALLYQLFNNAGTGCRCSEAFALRILRHVLRAGCFHGAEQRILGEPLGRCCGAFL